MFESKDEVEQAYREGYSRGKESAREYSTWVISSDGYYLYCESCGYRPPREAGATKFCPECGRDMGISK